MARVAFWMRLVEPSERLRVRIERRVGFQRCHQERSHLAPNVEAASGENSDDVFVGPDDDRLAATAARFVDAVERSGEHPPLIAITRLEPSSMRMKDSVACSTQSLRDDLYTVPRALVHEEVADSRHVARMKLEVSPAVGHALRIRRPVTSVIPKGSKRFFLAKSSVLVCAGLRDHGGQQVRTWAAVRPPRSQAERPSGAPKRTCTKCSLCERLVQLRLARAQTAVQAGGHRQEITKIDVGLPVRAWFRCQLGKEAEHALIQFEQAAVDGDADQGRRDALGDRGDVVLAVTEVRIEIGVHNQNAIPNDLHAVDRQVPFVDLLDDIADINALSGSRLRRHNI